MRNETLQQVWELRLQEQAKSGLAIRPWCEREGVTESNFHYWRRRLAVPTATKLIALPLAAERPEPALELRTPHGYVVRLTSRDQVGWLGGVLELLR
jgi:hypothetical protein